MHAPTVKVTVLLPLLRLIETLYVIVLVLAPSVVLGFATQAMFPRSSAVLVRPGIHSVVSVVHNVPNMEQVRLSDIALVGGGACAGSNGLLKVIV